MEYFEKIEKVTKDLVWNIPEQKNGIVNVIGGNAQHFKTEIKISEFLNEKYPIKIINTVLPDYLKTKLPTLPNFVFLKSTDMGSFSDENEINRIVDSADYNLLLGDFSKNSITKTVVSNVCCSSKKPLLITRDTIDLIASNELEKILMNENLIFFASIPQLIKVLQSVFYPKMLLISQSLIQVVEVLHKFTLSYPINIVTLHNEQILIAKNGNVKSVSLEASQYSPMMFFGGELAAKIVALNLYNPDSFIDATITAIFN